MPYERGRRPRVLGLTVGTEWRILWASLRALASRFRSAPVAQLDRAQVS